MTKLNSCDRDHMVWRSKYLLSGSTEKVCWKSWRLSVKLQTGGILLFLWLVSPLVNFKPVGRDEGVICFSRKPPASPPQCFMVGARRRYVFVNRTWNFWSESLFNVDFTVVTNILSHIPSHEAPVWSSVLTELLSLDCALTCYKSPLHPMWPVLGILCPQEDVWQATVHPD